MWSYSTNMMGPASLTWYEQNNIPYIEETKYSELFKKEVTNKKYVQYYGGRIDCYCSDMRDPNYNPYNQEISLPIMQGKYYGDFSDWLRKLKTKEWISSFEEIRTIYENETNKKIILFKEEKNN